MWFLVILTLVNSVLMQYGFQNQYRLSIGVAQIGVIEVLLAFGFIWAILRCGINRSQFPTPMSQSVLWILVALTIGLAFGMVGSIRSDVPLKDTLSSGREFGSIAICIFIGYALTATPKSARWFAWITAWAGILTSVLLLRGFGENTEKASLVGNLNPLRGTILEFNGEYAACTTLLLIYCLVIGVKLMPRWLMLVLAIFSFVAYLSTLSRTGTLVLAFGILASYFLLPKGKRVGKMFKAAMLGVVIGAAVLVSLLFADAIIGRDFLGKLGKHFEAMLPADETSTQPRAYNARLAAAQIELGIWMENPLMGQGFDVQNARLRRGQIEAAGYGYNHNGWTSTLAKTGMFGFLGVAGCIGALMFIGWRMVRQASDSTDLIVGGMGFVVGCVFFVRACCSMAFTSRAAIDFALTCGVLLRAREMQLAKRAALLEYEYQPQPQGFPVDALQWGYAPDHGAGRN